MNMRYEIGQFVGYVDAEPEAPRELPLPRRWYVEQVHPGKEAKIVRAFDRDGISFYFPVCTEQRTFQRRRHGYECEIRTHVKVPLFQGLIFVPDFEVNDERRWERIKAVDGTIGLLRFGQWTAWLSPAHMLDIRRIEQFKNMPVSRKRRLWVQGQDVWVKDGPFAQFRGKIERLDSHGRLTVLLDIFKRLTPITLDEGQIEPA